MSNASLLLLNTPVYTLLSFYHGQGHPQRVSDSITILQSSVNIFYRFTCCNKSKHFEIYFTQAKKGWKECLSNWSPMEKLESMSSNLLLSSTSTSISTFSASTSTCNTSTPSSCTCVPNTSAANCFPKSGLSNMVNPTTNNAGRKRMDEEEERGRQIVFSLSINT